MSNRTTFSQRYYFDASYYKPGGPILLYLGGETSGPSRFPLMQTGIIKILMEATNGLGIILENRYYGESFPFNLSTTDNLRFLTTEQTIADNAYFAQHATFPGVTSNISLNAPHSPWILYGGSLAGSQAAFSLKTYGGDGGIIWGGIATSGVTKAVVGYSQWYAPIQELAPQDCVGSINGIVENIDRVFDTGNRTLINKMKGLFDMESLYDVDFARAIAFPIGGPFVYPGCTYQELNWDASVDCPYFWEFCRNVTDLTASANITSVDYALSEATNGEPWINLGNYANYIKTAINPYCRHLPLNHTPHGHDFCFGTQNETYWADVRPWPLKSFLYTSCTEIGFYQAAPESGPSLISKVLNVNYTQQWCRWAFPPGKYNSIPDSPDVDRINKYGGYNVVQKRLAHIDGAADVWRDACYHSTDAPERLTQNAISAYENPQLLIAGAGHCWNSFGLGGLANVSITPQFIQGAQYWIIRIVQKWVAEFHAQGS
ncbi:extracelular serine carboxypeptidase [Neohortaea acidophila]|uniref:Extracelular serine carboxypeptidase n=1 Tax=Neohortaea acidophila TaxID=245834 RepID=A0A6A6PU80_9PEZI|nr:extracelular serine carboxypeptidase [Neohortaea acidophila]KAF2483542.1 extracelular serine carboxypeptidase [Neohortaea acidophila]